MQRNDLENKEYCINNDAIHEELNETEDQIDNEVNKTQKLIFLKSDWSFVNKTHFYFRIKT